MKGIFYIVSGSEQYQYTKIPLPTKKNRIFRSTDFHSPEEFSAPGTLFPIAAVIALQITINTMPIDLTVIVTCGNSNP
jgi:hypothetical protein